MLKNVYNSTPDQIALAVKGQLKKYDSRTASLLHGAGFGATEVTMALSTAFGDSVGRIASVFYQGLFFPIDVVSAALGGTFNLSDSAVGAIMQSAGWAQDALKKLGDAFTSAFDR